jgi:hypothetical protein
MLDSLSHGYLMFANDMSPFNKSKIFTEIKHVMCPFLAWEDYHNFYFAFGASFAFSVCVVLGFELRGSCLLGSTLPLEPLPKPYFVLGIFKIGSCKAGADGSRL